MLLQWFIATGDSFLGQCATDKVFEIAGSEDLAYGSYPPDFEGGLVIVVLFFLILLS